LAKISDTHIMIQIIPDMHVWLYECMSFSQILVGGSAALMSDECMNEWDKIAFKLPVYTPELQ
jgi:hypothetical protein